MGLSLVRSHGWRGSATCYSDCTAIYRDLNTRQAIPMDVPSNVFCASGMHLPNGSFATFGGNAAVGRGGRDGDQAAPDGSGPLWDQEYQDFDGRKAIRILDPCVEGDDFNSVQCTWFDDASVLAMQRPRWYSTAEPLADGTIVMIGGFTAGGYINRNYPNTEPDGGGSQNSFEFFPNRGDAVHFPFLTRTSGLNTYVHAYMMPSGRMFLQANLSASAFSVSCLNRPLTNKNTVLWDYDQNEEFPLPEMPKGVVRVYPASGAVAMLPLTPANNYNPTILFCGGQDMTDEQWGDFAFPRILVWDKPASRDCQRITPEPTDGSEVVYEQDDDMPEGRTMGQFIILPDGKLLVLNGALNGTAGYAKSISLIPDPSDMPVGESLAIGPVLTPAIYDPNAPRGSRWSQKGLQASNIPRMYHSSALLLPDASVIIAGSNPNVDVNLTTVYPTTYAAEIFYPPYFNAPVRPKPQGVPKTLSYGGDPFDITIAADQFSGSANDAAKGAIVAIVRPGFTTHALNMGQRFLQLDHTYTVKKEGTITLHVAQPPPNAHLFQPGPAFLYVTINGVPSNGTHVIVGNGRTGPQTLSDASVLPQSVNAEGATGKASPESTNNGGDGSTKSGETEGLSMTSIIGFAAGGAALLAIVGAIVFFVVRRRRAASAAAAADSVRYGPLGGGPSMANIAGGAAYGDDRAAHDSDQTSFVPLRQTNHSHNWSQSSFQSNNYPQNHQYIPQQQPSSGYGHNPYPSQYSQASFQPHP